NVFFNLQIEKLHNFQLFTFNFQLFPGGDGGQIARATGGEQRAVENRGRLRAVPTGGSAP
ncbi:MAG: hypothetical protein IJG08_04755, partial [Oscillospiraceae bacterium]|nr:hypothetical protein [Oscillospiraceae bacterium]